ncbi:MAG TPA: glycosyltransferase 87 family protein, partial [Ktedonobacterales bacterium]|nr:glycosyltransferase 87 family protein [Ktedonobacterales bacterium]
MFAAYAAAWFFLVRLPGDILRSPIAGSDLSSYYTAGYLARTGQAAHLYDVAPGDTILGDATAGPWRVAGDTLRIERQHYYIYPPFFALAAAPLSLLSFEGARTVWMLMDLTLLGLFVWLYLAWRRGDGVPAQPLEIGLIAVTLGLEFLPLIWALTIG